MLSQNKIITGIELELPKLLEDKLFKEVSDHFSRIQIAEIIIEHKENAKASEGSGPFRTDYSMSTMAQDFEELGFDIKNVCSS